MHRLRMMIAFPLGLLGLALVILGMMLEQLAEWAAEGNRE